MEKSDWSNEITWNYLAILLVREIGPEKAVAVLESIDLPDGVLSPNFHRACLLSGMVKRQQT